MLRSSHRSRFDGSVRAFDVSFAVLVLLLMTVGAPARAQVRNAEPAVPPQLFEVSVDKYLMGTLIEATVHYRSVEDAQRYLVEAFQEMERIESVMSVNKDSSALSKINREASRWPVKVDGEVYGILRRSKDYCYESGGLFDVTIGPLSKLWGFSGDDPVVVPDSASIAALLDLVGCDLLLLNDLDSTVAFAASGMALDLGGVAKGYAVDRAAALLRSRGVDNFLINAGGDLYVSGEKEAGVPWRVGVKHPRDPKKLIARLVARDEAVITSGDYERFVIVGGHRYHHILDPRTGWPATASQSVTVVASSAEAADALGTALFIAGVEAMAEEGNAEELRVAADGTVRLSGGIAERNGVEVLE